MKYALTREEQEWVNTHMLNVGLPLDRNVAFDEMPIGDDWSEVETRSEIYDDIHAFEVELAPGVTMGIPIMMANMDCLCGRSPEAGARAIAAIEEEGGPGFPPQMMALNGRKEMLRLVGRTHCAYIDNPLIIGPHNSLREAKNKMRRHGINSLVVVENGRPVGMLSHRDWIHESDDAKLVEKMMTGTRYLKTAPKNINFDEAAKLFRKYRIEKLPLVNKNGKLAGLLTAHGLFYKDYYPRAIRDDKGRFLKFGSVGVGRKFGKKHLHEVEAQLKEGICLLLIDTARAFSINAKWALEAVKKNFPNLPVMIGNTCTPEGTKFLFEHGADIVKVGIGPGSGCTTRRTGIGLPQLSVIGRCAAIAKRYGKKIVGDGGVSGPGQILKALGAGADAVMAGKLLFGTEESAAEAKFLELKNHDFIEGEIKYKVYEGSASFAAQYRRVGKGEQSHINEPEGREVFIPVTCRMGERIRSQLRWLASAMSYRGAHNLKELHEVFRFDLPQGSAGFKEGVK